MPSGPEDTKWEAFSAARKGYIHALAHTVEQSFVRKDTAHPAFCGCIDWHSSVHGAYALLTASRLTGHLPWSNVVDAALAPVCLEAEFVCLRRGDLNHELPYGYAWFLALAQEREQGWGRQDLLPMASDIASRLASWVFGLSDNALIHHAQRQEYGNLSWAVLNLWRWGKWQQDFRLQEALSKFVQNRILPLDRSCLSHNESSTEEFFSAALQRYRALLTILPPDVSSNWLASHPPHVRDWSPLNGFPTAHAAGLNFSRSWGLWTLFQHTQDVLFRNQYVDHIVSHFHIPQYWREDYRKHAHWVPQFGIYAIALSFEELGNSSSRGTVAEEDGHPA